MRGRPGALLALLLASAVRAAAPQACSADGRWCITAEAAELTIFDAAGRSVRSHVAAAADGSHRSAVAALFDAAPRHSFVVAFETLPELWEISYDTNAEPIYQGMVHDYRQREGIAEAGYLNLRRTLLSAPLRALGFDRSHAFVIGRAPDRADGQAVLHLVQLDVRKRIAEFVLRGDPNTAAARPTRLAGRDLLEVPDRGPGPTLLLDFRAARLLTQRPP